VSKFLLRRGLAATDLSPDLIEQFVAAMRAKNRSWRPTARSLSWLVDYLTEIGVVTAPAAARERSGRQALIERYRDYLTVEREHGAGLSTQNPYNRSGDALHRSAQ
jgi:hypothetical protein